MAKHDMPEDHPAKESGLQLRSADADAPTHMGPRRLDTLNISDPTRDPTPTSTASLT